VSSYHPDTKGMNGVWREDSQENQTKGRRKGRKPPPRWEVKKKQKSQGPLRRERKETREEKAGGGKRAKINSLVKLVTAPKAPIIV
jgi:hypothetical protein